MRYVAFTSLLLLVAELACGPKPGAKAVLPDVPFDELDHNQRLQLMKQVVMPTMAPLFQEHDRERYAKFGCRTCHGASVDRDEYHMPNDKLPKLNFSDMSKFKPEDIEFMKSKVVPTMARILKQPEHSAENPQGFGCLECHTRAAPTARAE
jgi:hypothetical protein